MAAIMSIVRGREWGVGGLKSWTEQDFWGENGRKFSLKWFLA